MACLETKSPAGGPAGLIPCASSTEAGSLVLPLLQPPQQVRIDLQLRILLVVVEVQLAAVRRRADGAARAPLRLYVDALAVTQGRTPRAVDLYRAAGATAQFGATRTDTATVLEPDLTRQQAALRRLILTARTSDQAGATRADATSILQPDLARSRGTAAARPCGTHP